MWFVGLGCGAGGGDLDMRGGATSLENEHRLHLSRFLIYCGSGG